MLMEYRAHDKQAGVLRLFISGIILLLSLVLLACQRKLEGPQTRPPPTPAPISSSVPTLTATATATAFQGRVEIDGATLFIRCEGTGSPIVILGAGPGDFWVTWQKVMPGVAAFTHVCAYDRAGLGASSSGPTPRTSQQMAVELHGLLTAANLPGPYVLVSHATSNWIARVFAGKHPEDVAGMVFISPMHEDMLSRLESIFAPYPEQWAQTVWDVEHQGEGQSYEDWQASAAQVRAAGTLGDIPLVIVARGTDRSQEGPAQAEIETMLLELEKELLGLSSNSTYIVVENSGHFIQREQPQAVIDAIYQVVETVR